MAISAWALNVPYQAELCEDYAKTREPATWEDVRIVSDFCLRVQRCAVQHRFSTAEPGEPDGQEEG